MSRFVLDSPVGLLFAEVTEHGLRRLDLLSRERDLGGARTAGEDTTNGTHFEAPPPAFAGPTHASLASPTEDDMAERVQTQLLEYFEGERRSFDLPLDVEGGSEFQRSIWRAIAGIPYSEVMSYAEVAIAAGYPNAFRAAGSACGANPVAIVTPCHRVIASAGRLGGYGLGLETKVWLLRHEGIGCDRVAPDALIRRGNPFGF